MWTFCKLIFWGLVWLPAWMWIEVYRKLWKRPRMDNCLSWSLRQWENKGGYLVIRWCRINAVPFLAWPHFLWLPDKDHEHLQHYVPIEPDGEIAKHVLPDLWFRGRIQKGDPEDVIEN